MGLFTPKQPARTGKVLPNAPQAPTVAPRRELADTSGLITETDLRAMETAGATVTRRHDTVTVHTPIPGGRQTDTYTVHGHGQYRIR